MFREYERRENDKRKFNLLIHGGKIDEGTTTVQAISSAPDEVPTMFKDPSEYEGMSDEEKKELTRKMMQGHKNILLKSNTALMNEHRKK